MSNIIRLRPHHFLCMLAYIGKGYSDVFVEYYDQIIERLNSEDCHALVVAEPDDICAPRLCDPDDTTCHCRESHIVDRDKEAIEDIRKLQGFESLSIGTPFHLTKSLIKQLRNAYKANEIRTACTGCEWKTLCDDIAANDFKGTKLL